ncbi:MAG: hypothetical protein M1832_001174 [Thelocarpon impressellum]|nr:MAG: hypothetical protein M1832_001174 [Thelocarpon impressellum]
MSYLQKQVDAFKTDLSSTSSKISNKRTVGVAPPASTPPPTGTPQATSASKQNELKRKRPEPSSVVYSQPADTGTGRYIMTQVTYAVEHLKKKEAPRTLAQIVDHLSLQSQNPDSRRNIAAILKRHERVEYTRGAAGSGWEAGTYRFRPMHDIRSATELLSRLQTQRTAQGLSVRELKEGWSGAEEAIDALEARGQVLVTRNKKDGHARMVWANDPSLTQTVSSEFQLLWHKIKLPDREELPAELVKLGHKPTSADPAGPNARARTLDKRKAKKPKRGGRTTNTHMAGILKDYSSMKK